MFPRLLVPLDGSPVAAQAVPYAIPLTRAFHSHVVLLSIVEPASDWSGMPRVAAQEADERARALAMAYLGDVTDRFHAEGLVVSADVQQGNPAATILAAAEEHDCALIAMATHGRSGINRLRLGSVAQHVVRHAPIPILVVRATDQASADRAEAITEVVVTLDGSTIAEQALPVAAALGDALHVPLTLFEVLPNYAYMGASAVWPGMYYAPTPEQDAEDEKAVTTYLEETARTLGVPGREVRTAWQRSMTNHADPVILTYLAARPTGLAVMASHGRGGIARWVLGSTAEAVIARPPCSVLVVPALITACASLNAERRRQRRARSSCCPMWQSPPPHRLAQNERACHEGQCNRDKVPTFLLVAALRFI